MYKMTWKSGKVKISREPGFSDLDISIDGFHVCTFTESEARETLKALAAALDMQLGRPCFTCGGCDPDCPTCKGNGYV